MRYTTLLLDRTGTSFLSTTHGSGTVLVSYCSEIKGKTTRRLLGTFPTVRAYERAVESAASDPTVTPVAGWSREQWSVFVRGAATTLADDDLMVDAVTETRWKRAPESQRRELVARVLSSGTNVSEWCRRNPDRPSRSTVYGWVARYAGARTKVPHLGILSGGRR